MSTENDKPKPKRRLKKGIRTLAIVKCKLKVWRLERRVKELEDKLTGG